MELYVQCAKVGSLFAAIYTNTTTRARRTIEWGRLEGLFSKEPCKQTTRVIIHLQKLSLHEKMYLHTDRERLNGIIAKGIRGILNGATAVTQTQW